MLDAREHVLGDQVALGDVGVAGQDERADAGVLIRTQLGDDLVGIADDRRAGAAARPADAGPERVLDEAVVGGALAERGLAWTPTDAASSDLLRIASPVSTSSCETSRSAAARASASVSRTIMWARKP